MKCRHSFILAALLSGSIGLNNTVFAASDASLQSKGKVQRILINPEGAIDGLLLDDGTQVKFSPRMPQQLLALVKPSDSVSVKGFRENAKVFKAESITNTVSNKTIAETTANPPEDGPGDGHGERGPKGHKGHKGHKGPKDHEGLTELTAQGKIQNQLFGKKGEVNGAVLADGSIVRFSPRVFEDAKINVDIGQTLKVTGFGTQNSNGKSLEATTVSNN